MKQWYTVFGLMICLSLVGCERVGDDPAPEVSEVFANITHYHPSYWQKAGMAADLRLASTLEFRINDPDGISDLHEVDLLNETEELSFPLLRRSGNVLFGSAYNQALDLFRNTSTNTQQPSRIELHGWKVRAKDLSGAIRSRDFDYRLPDGSLSEAGDFVYSPDYVGDMSNGVPTMEAMTTAGNGLSLTVDSVNEFFDIEFQTADLNASHYEILFYGDDPKAQEVGIEGHIGILRYDAQVIDATPINHGGTTIVTVFWDDEDLELHPNFSAEDLVGAHVVLYDAPVDFTLVQNAVWFSYAGVSEYFTLTP